MTLVPDVPHRVMSIKRSSASKTRQSNSGVGAQFRNVHLKQLNAGQNRAISRFARNILIESCLGEFNGRACPRETEKTPSRAVSDCASSSSYRTTRGLRLETPLPPSSPYPLLILYAKNGEGEKKGREIRSETNDWDF